jgi:tetratricopeptide (TPR) repeat protein
MQEDDDWPYSLGVTPMFRPSIRLISLPTGFLLLTLAVSLAAQPDWRASDARELGHQSADWLSVQAHLADPVSSTIETLQMQGDILRARRFPYDALNYYGYALKRDSKNVGILKRLGVTQLELRNVELARSYFERAVKLDKKDAEAWNNLGAVEYLDRNHSNSISDYKRAVKLKGQSAIYHSNLAIAYFEERNFSRGRKEMATALKLDPHLFSEAGATGISAHVLSSEDRARFCLEMAKTYAEEGDVAEMLHSLETAAQAGLDLAAEMGKDKILAEYRTDPRVLILIQNAKALRSGSTMANGAKPPVIPSITPVTE